MVLSRNHGADESRRTGITNQVLWFVFALSFIDGAVFNLLPATFPAFKTEFRVSLEQLGRTQLCFFLSTLLYGLLGGWFAARLGLRRATVVSLVGLAAGLMIVGGAPGFSILLMGAFLFGCALSGIEVLTNAIVSEEFSDRRQSIFFIWGVVNAVGATLGPIWMGHWVRNFERSGVGWRFGYWAPAVALFGLVVWGLFLSKPHAPQMEVQNEKRPAPTSHLGAVLRTPAVYGVGMIMFLHGLSQCGMVSWVGQLYIRRFAVDPVQAAYFISFNSGGFFVGRSLLGWITARWRVPELVVLAACSAGSTLAFVATIAAPSYRAGLVIFAIAGMFVSANGPSSYSYLGFRFAGRSATAFAVMNGIACVGAASGPYLVGVIGNHFGLIKGIWFLPIFSLGLSAMALIWYTLTKKSAREQQPIEAPAAEVSIPDIQ